LSPLIPDNINEQAFRSTATPFGLIQREAERLGLGSTTIDRKVETSHARDDHVTYALPRKIQVAITDSALGVDVTASATQGLVKLSNRNDPLKPDEAPNTDIALGQVSASAHAGFGISGVGATAGVNANILSTSIGPVTAQVGIGLSTGIFLSPIQFTVMVAGTGVRVGEDTGISIAGSSIDINVGNIVENVGNEILKHDPHINLRHKIAEKQYELEHKVDPHHHVRETMGHIHDVLDSVKEKTLYPAVQVVEKGATTGLNHVDNTIIKAGKSVENIVVENVKLQKIQDSNMVVTFHEKNRNKNKKKKKR